jgi:hypothetical protein
MICSRRVANNYVGIDIEAQGETPCVTRNHGAELNLILIGI